MRIIVVWESMFGNTRNVAEAIAAGFEDDVDVRVVEVSDADSGLVATADLLVAGGPTHIHGLTGKRSRITATDHAIAGVMSKGDGVREWLEALADVDGTPAAAFDTRVDKPRWLVGSAAQGIAKRLRQKGYALVADPESFFVDNTEGPLRDNDTARAKAWGLTIQRAAQAATDLRGEIATRCSPARPLDRPTAEGACPGVYHRPNRVGTPC